MEITEGTWADTFALLAGIFDNLAPLPPYSETASVEYGALEAKMPAWGVPGEETDVTIASQVPWEQALKAEITRLHDLLKVRTDERDAARAECARLAARPASKPSHDWTRDFSGDRRRIGG